MLGLIFGASLNAQNQESYSTSKLIAGCPAEIKPISDQLGLSNLSYSNLKTGIDTLKILFGELTQGKSSGYWISLFGNGKLLTFTTVNPMKNKASGFPSDTVGIEYDDSSKKISVLVTHNTSTNQIQYSWLKNNNQKSKTATIVTIEKPLQKGKLFPATKFVSLNSDSISTKSFPGKYIVINWWATTCGPCRQEIPGLNSLVEKYKSNSDVVFLAVAFNKKEDLEYYLNLKEFKYIQTLGDKGTAKLFGESFPKNLIINPRGMITYYSEGGNEGRFLEIDKELKLQMSKN
jgi:thiol-disulfide isomerase/thioredoxin